MKRDAFGVRPTASGEGRLRRGMYIVPSLFTSGNIAAGYFAITQSLQGSVQEPRHFNYAALAIGFAIPFDALDGRIARMTKTTSEFGKELDSLADVITFGVAPSLLAFTWGFQMLPMAMDPVRRQHVVEWGAFVCFLFLLCGAGRLARFNIGANPIPTNPGRPGRKYFVGMPIPAAAGVIAAVVHFFSGTPVPNWRVAIMWMLLVFLVGLLMVSTWRFWSGKEINLSDRHPFQRIVLMGLAIYATVVFSQIRSLSRWPSVYMFSGIFARAAYSWQRRHRRMTTPEAPWCSMRTPHPNRPCIREQASRSMTTSYRIAIVGAASIRGKQLNEALAESSFAASEFLLMDDQQALGQLEAVGDEITFIQPITADSFERVDFTFFAGSAELTRRHWQAAQRAGSSIVDLSAGLEGEPGVLVCAPWVQEAMGEAAVAGAPNLHTPAVVSAHPAALVLALLLERLQRAGAIRQVSATVLEPASEYGRAALDELHQQTVTLLSFQSIPTQVYDVQVAFNTVGRVWGGGKDQPGGERSAHPAPLCLTFRRTTAAAFSATDPCARLPWSYLFDRRRVRAAGDAGAD